MTPTRTPEQRLAPFDHFRQEFTVLARHKLVELMHNASRYYPLLQESELLALWVERLGAPTTQRQRPTLEDTP